MVMGVSQIQTNSDIFFFSKRRRHTIWNCDWSSDVCSSDLQADVCHRRPGLQTRSTTRVRVERGHGERNGIVRCRQGDRKSTRLNSSHSSISYAVFCLKKKKSEAAPAASQTCCSRVLAAIRS